MLFRAGSLADDVPIPVEALVNGDSIVPCTVAKQVECFHLERDSHDVIWAEGAASETYLEDGSVPGTAILVRIDPPSRPRRLQART